MKYVSLFAGIGGFDLALNKLGHLCVYANEWDKRCADIYEKHFGKRPDERDIRTVDAYEIPDHELLVGGFPCPDFSIAGYRKGFDGEQGDLFFEICRILAVKRPTYLLLENVRGLLNHNRGKTFKTILRKLDELGYETEYALYYSTDFGVPQSRPRVYIRGTFRRSEGQIDAGKRIVKETPILFKCKTRFRNKDYNWKEIGRMSTEIIREDAGISIELDGRIAKNGEEITVR